MKNNNSQQTGFTLVEIALVMVIIGLLTGGILKGREMMDVAKASDAIAEIRRIQAAIIAFRELHKTMPGDMSIADAVAKIPDCNAGNGCAVNGNRNGITDGPSFTTSGVENAAAWIQLAQMDMLVNESTATTGYKTPLGGEFMLNYVGGGADFNAHYLWLVQNASAAAAAGNEVPELTAVQGSKIDAKLDDGIPGSGRVRGWSCLNGGEWNTAVQASGCYMLIYAAP